MFNKNTIHYTKLFLIYSQVVVQSLVVNIVLFFIGKSLGGFGQNLITPRGQPINLVSIITPTIVFPLLGALTYIFISKFSSKPLKYFRIAGYGFILFMFAGPLRLENSTISDMIILEVMHLVVGVQFIEFVSRSMTKMAAKPAQTLQPEGVKKQRTINL
jgi:Family of unknown function (DUF6069)